MPTELSHDLEHLVRLVSAALYLNKPSNVEEATMLADIRDHLMYLILDALEDPSLARILIDNFAEVEKWLHEKNQKTAPWQSDQRENLQFYIGFICALEQLLSLKHAITKLPREKISREAFTASWSETARKLAIF